MRSASVSRPYANLAEYIGTRKMDRPAPELQVTRGRKALPCADRSSILRRVTVTQLGYASVISCSLAFSPIVACSGNAKPDSASGGSTSSGAESGGAGPSIGGSSNSAGSSSADSGGSTSSTGGASTSLSAPTHGLARGAISFHIPSGCSIAGGYIDAPAVSGGHPVTADGPTLVLTDGEQLDNGRANVACAYLGRDPVNARVSISTSAGGVSFASRLPLVMGQATECGIAVTLAATQTEGLGPTTACSCTTLSDGGFALLVKIECPDLAPNKGGEQCPLTEGFIYFDGCE